MQPEQKDLMNQQMKEFEELTRPLIKWLNDNYHPHHTIIIEPTGAELLESQAVFPTNEYIHD